MWEPFGVANSTASWRSGPNERGTLNILSSCLITLVLCIYTCLHLNIPGPKEKTWAQRMKRKSLWLVVGLFAPEFVAFSAYFDWYSARTMTLHMQEALDPLLKPGTEKSSPRDIEAGDGDPHDTNPTPSTTRPHSRRTFRWTRVHSHFALMGGFVFDMQNVEKKFAPNNANQLTLTTKLLRQLAIHDPDIIPDISDQQIRDKSKADNFTKGLVCVQALWFVAQTVGRLAVNSPISLLEMNTLLHALCCFIIYGAWWHKPLDIDEPSPIDVAGHNIEQFCAWLIMCSSRTRGMNIHRDVKTKAKLPTFEFFYYDGGAEVWREDRIRKVAIQENLKLGHPGILDPDDPNVQWSSTDDEEQPYLRLYSGQQCLGHFFFIRSVERSKGISVHLSEGDIERLRLRQKFERTQADKRSNYQGTRISIDYVRCCAARVTPSDSELTRTPDDLFPWLRRYFSDPSDFDELLMIFVFFTGVAAAGTFYGGVHLIAWNNNFPSLAEAWIWRISCFLIAAPFPIIVFAASGFAAFFLLRRWLRDDVPNEEHGSRWCRCAVRSTLEGLAWMIDNMRLYELLTRRKSLLGRKVSVSDIFYILVVGLIGLFVLAYVGARVYLIVESFINLAHLPDAAYQEPEWSKYIPHFGLG